LKRLVFRRAAGRDLLLIFEHVAIASGSIRAAHRLEAALRQRMRRIARLPGVFGRSREELAPGLRSVAEKSYVIFFRYRADAIEVVRVFHGHQDVDATYAEE
jgi:toxin ParE1/3/4